ncbi:hypothetical protein BCR39DRAFT_530107 [Naematelia encephala]|uniref:NF-X1-type domain-containing protein n=1 Tax=Naematelia encephala TaxID=71784 RepID=A0A1Y2B6R8_9TREE|nr:hypothetical protein BCR39DRAFT_530107 [Naematelia encephala]
MVEVSGLQLSASKSAQPQVPRPGDGAFLTAARPGDGTFLSNGHSRPARGTGRSGGVGVRGGPSNHRGRARGFAPLNIVYSNGQTAALSPANSNSAELNNNTDVSLPPSSAAQSTTLPQSSIVPNGHFAEVNGSSHGAGTAKANRARGGSGRRGARENGQAGPSRSDGDIDRTVPESSTTIASLDPSASAFVPRTSASQPASRTASPSRTNKPRKTRPPKKEPIQPAPQVSSRRAAFDLQTKLTATVSRSSDGNVERQEALHGQTEEYRAQQKRKVKEEKDDLVSRLTRGLKNRPFLECPICFNSITPAQQIWCCLPPEHVPDVSGESTPSPDVVFDAKRYSSCYTPFHISCIRDWANRSLVEDTERMRNFSIEDEDPSWRCPGCQKRRTDPVGGYKCFCGRLTAPPTNGAAPHSCGDACSRKRIGCDHPCSLPCHPGPCPPCQVALTVPCPSHHTRLTVKCALATTNNAALSPVCDEICGRQRACGNADHRCDLPCHYGPCKPCDIVETVRCFCGEESREAPCGWAQENAQLCQREPEDGEKGFWKGRFSCGKPCDRMFDCGIHPCEETCHSHPIFPVPCPNSPSVITTCPCGSTPLSALPGYPRPDCLAPIPTCSEPCPKVRPCGHTCPRKCHRGECPPCHEEVVRPCRCGESVLVVSCDELRERAESGEGDLTCERVCKALRSCGRHECGRVCCPLSYQAKNRKDRKKEDAHLGNREEDDLHACPLTCGKLLSCGIHTCSRKDHRGACGRCLQASYDELICHCGHTVVYPPIACGTTIDCIYPCARPPPECGHPKTPHNCHEAPECPPCPYLSTRPCACGKDPAVKNVRCSAERVSCGQVCGEPLACGYHRCEKSCHRPGECGSCTQVCNKPKRICRHPCTAPCHAPARCPENEPCQAIVTQSCACGNLQSRSSCGASTSKPTSRETVVLKCNSECAIKQRNARLADALGIAPKERVTQEWSEDMKTFAFANHAFVKMVEGTFRDFFQSTRQTAILPHMPQSKRVFVLSLADAYRLGRELIDQEPNRSVQIRRRIDTRIPQPLLSASVPPPSAKPSLGGLTIMRSAGAWGGGGGGAGVGSGGWGSASVGGIKGGTAAAVVAGERPSRAATPIAPVLQQPARNGTSTPTPLATSTPHVQPTGTAIGRARVGEIGVVEDDDWDRDD